MAVHTILFQAATVAVIGFFYSPVPTRVLPKPLQSETFSRRCLSKRQLTENLQYHNEPSGCTSLYSKVDGQDGHGPEQDSSGRGGKKRVRDVMKGIARNLVSRPISTAAAVAPAPSKIARVLTDATAGAVDMAVDGTMTPLDGGPRKIRRSRAFSDVEDTAAMEAEATSALDAIALAKTTAADAFDAAESAIRDAENALGDARRALLVAKMEAAEGIASAESAAVEALSSAQRATAFATRVATTTLSKEEGEQNSINDSSEDPIAEEEAMSLSYDDVDYHLSEMAPPFINEDQCLVPGEALVRVEKAPENSRRIFAGIDIMASIEDVWNVSIFLSFVTKREL